MTHGDMGTRDDKSASLRKKMVFVLVLKKVGI